MKKLREKKKAAAKNKKAAAKNKSTSNKTKTTTNVSNSHEKKHIGEVYTAETKYIDKDTKKHRRYAVVDEKNGNIRVSKIKSIKKFSTEGKNADKALIEIDSSYPGLTKRTGVDFEVFHKNRINKKNLTLEKDNEVFNEKPDFILNDIDKKRVRSHVHLRGRKNRKK